MPFAIICGDITAIKADAIVNTANPDPVIGAARGLTHHAVRKTTRQLEGNVYDP